ncbi:MAG: TolC family protein [Nevskia sp.]
MGLCAAQARLAMIRSILVPAVVSALAALAASAVVHADGEGCSAELGLAQVEARVEHDNLDVRLARQAIDGARADVTTAGERPNPVLSLNSSSYDLRRGLGPGDALHKQSDTILRLDQPIERGGKRGLRVDAARAGLLAAQADYAEQRRESLQAVRTAFYALLRAQHKLEIEREIDELQQQTLAAAERRRNAGDLSASDLARLRVEALKAANDRQRAEAEQRAARAALAVLIGCAADSPFAMAAGTLPAPVAVIAQPGDAAPRPDVAAAEARAAQARSAFDLAKAQRVRDVSIGLQVEHYPNGVPTPGDGQLLAGIGISLPLFLFNRYDGEIARAAADAEASRTQLARARAVAEADRAAAQETLAAAAAVVQRYRDAILPQAQVAAEAVEYAYAHGATPLLDLLDARRTLRNTRIEQADADYDYAAAFAGWQAASDRYAPPN